MESPVFANLIRSRPCQSLKTSLSHGPILRPRLQSTSLTPPRPTPRWLSSTSCRSQATPSSPQTPASNNRPLEGITIVSLEQAIAGPFCTRQLADLGARVIKVERPGRGDFARDYDDRVNGLSSHFTWTNRSKESLTLDLKNPGQLSTLKKLLSKADVLVQNLAPGATTRLGLSYEELSKAFPRLIVCDISGYGSYGPYRDKKAYDLLIQSEAGFLSVTGTPSTPAKAGCSIADIAAGMYAYTNILAAILNRQKTGRGCRLDVSMLESMVEWMNFPLYYAYEGAEPPVPVGVSHAAVYPYGDFMAGDGKAVMLGIQNEREWAKFCEEVIENPSLATDERFNSNKLRSLNRDALKSAIEQGFKQFDAETVVKRLDKAGIANANVNDMHGVWVHPQLKARERWREVETPVGKVPALLPPGCADGWDVKMGRVPGVGQDSKRILKELEETGS
jgi:itaconate CoA-transferase